MAPTSETKTGASQAARPILPGATLGMLGSGQLGRMFAQAAARLGYFVHVFSPDAGSPTSQVARQETIADYDDTEAVAKFAQSVDVVSFEFENVSAAATETIAKYVPVRPSGRVLHITQDRLREKRFLQSAGIPCTPFAEITSGEELSAAVDAIGTPAVLKTTAWGYDGKGQAKINTAADAPTAWQSLDGQPVVYEGWVDYQQEFSVLVTRSTIGEIAICGPIANEHANHILDLSVYPAPELAGAASEAGQIARTIVEQLDVVGIICVEFFLTTDNRLLVNEIAPRPHNSGHLTIEACRTSQFEQQVRAICGLPLGESTAHCPAAMANLLGDLWQSGEPNWQAALTDPHVHLHLYGKAEARPGRKMGHLTVLADTAEEAVRRAIRARDRLAVAGQ
ncbi:MAG: 5-(carboxyamino)imidazole ribonucleotide synthase [Planctomycetes bacterium]|nr:5-(carboxyamino)imidazole ribonucleotide synthase [Planctomycetota bacterium]